MTNARQGSGLARQFEVWSWRVWPAGSTFILLLTTALPGRLLPFSDILPLFGFLGIYYWRLFRPSLMPFWAILLLGLIHDAMAGMPPGLSSFVWLVFALFLSSQRRLFTNEAFLAVWFGFAVLSLVLWGMQSVLMGMMRGAMPALLPFLLQWLVTVGVYPAMHALFNRIYANLPALYGPVPG